MTPVTVGDVARLRRMVEEQSTRQPSRVRSAVTRLRGAVVRRHTVLTSALQTPRTGPVGAVATGAPPVDVPPIGAIPAIDHPATDHPATEPPAATSPHGAPSGATAHEVPSADDLDGRFGRPGRAFSRQHPFFVGFVGAVGVLLAYGLVQVLSQLAQVLTLLAVSLFLALGLEPVVEALQRRRLPRGVAIGAVFLGVVAVFVGFGFAVVPILVAQGGELATQVPAYFTQVQQADWFTQLDARYDIVSRFTTELETRLTDGQTASTLFGGVLGAGAAVVGGVFNVFTVLVLTLYFLASMPTLRATAYRLVPRSRRQRVQLLGDEISRRIGGYVIGQIAIATLNGICTYVVLLIVGVPYPALLAIVVGLFGLIPLVGATLGAVVVVVVALFSSVPDAVVVGGYYLIYQQVENYMIAPKVMQRAVSVPGALAVVAALAGGSLLGILGALVAIPLAAGGLLIVQQVIVPRQDRQ